MLILVVEGEIELDFFLNKRYNKTKRDLMNTYISGKFLDIYLMSFSSIILFGIFYYLNLNSLNYIYISLFYVVLLIDIFHVYLTIPRAYLDFKKNKYFFILTPILVFLFIFIFLENKLFTIWTLIFYFAIFHFIKQNFGITRWYLSLNKRKDRVIDHLVFLLLFLPFIAFHFSIEEIPIYYVSDTNALLNMPNLELYNTFVILNILTIVIYILYELRLWFVDKIQETGRVIFMVSNTIFYNLVFFLGYSFIDIVIIILFNHAIQYIVLNYRISQTFYKLNKKRLIYLLIIPIVFTLFEFFSKYILTENNISYYEYNSIYLNILLSFIWTPLLSHYIIDFKIWTNDYFKSLN